MKGKRSQGLGGAIVSVSVLGLILGAPNRAAADLNEDLSPIGASTTALRTTVGTGSTAPTPEPPASPAASETRSNLLGLTS